MTRNLKQILGIGALVLAGAIALGELTNYAIDRFQSRKPELVYPQTQPAEFSSPQEAYKGLEFDPKTKTWNSPKTIKPATNIPSKIEAILNSPNLNTPPKIKTIPKKNPDLPYQEKNPDSIDEIIRHLTTPRYDQDPIDYQLVKDTIRVESKGNPNARGKFGEIGLMQIKPSTWREQTKKLYGKPIGLEWAYSKWHNIETGIDYQRDLDAWLSKAISEYSSMSKEKKKKLIAAAYNCGPGNLIQAYHISKNLATVPKSTKEYIRKVTGRGA
jgi:hypothetical protein